MTRAQDSLYWREWGAAGRRCRESNLPAPDRHALHIAALGADKSHVDFTNADFDKVLAQFRSISRPADVSAQLQQIDQPRRRLLWKIRHMADTPYWQQIAQDKFGHANLDDLSTEQLTQLRNTLAARA